MLWLIVSPLPPLLQGVYIYITTISLETFSQIFYSPLQYIYILKTLSHTWSIMFVKIFWRCDNQSSWKHKISITAVYSNVPSTYKNVFQTWLAVLSWFLYALWLDRIFQVVCPDIHLQEWRVSYEATCISSKPIQNRKLILAYEGNPPRTIGYTYAFLDTQKVNDYSLHLLLSHRSGQSFMIPFKYRERGSSDHLHNQTM